MLRTLPSVCQSPCPPWTRFDESLGIKTLAGDEEAIDDSLGVIPWTIKNKYYTAPVHFQPSHFQGLEALDLDDVPAIIYVWKGKEVCFFLTIFYFYHLICFLKPFKQHLPLIREEVQASSSKPEVSLAISMGPSAEEVEEDYFFELGFEYIDGHQDTKQSISTGFDSMFV